MMMLASNRSCTMSFCCLSLALMMTAVQAFQPSWSSFPRPHVITTATSTSSTGTTVAFMKANGDASHSSSSSNPSAEENSDNLLGQSSAASRLSHAMLQVQSVDDTVAFWQDTKNAQITASSPTAETDKSSDKLWSAFVVLGNGKSVEDCFALELVRNKHKEFQLGTGLSYLGVSKLIQFANANFQDLVGLFDGSNKGKPNEEEEAKEPNGIPIVSCASAPGDFLARFCLRCTNMEATAKFYTIVLGMELAAMDENGKMMCLRYGTRKKDDDKKDDTSSSFYGVPTTLVFEPVNKEESSLEIGNCFDHLVIKTNADMEKVWEQLQGLVENNGDCTIFIKPTEMFGQKVIGLMDPDGYKIILAGKV